VNWFKRYPETKKGYLHSTSKVDHIQRQASRILKENQFKSIGKLNVQSLNLETLNESKKEEQIDALGYVLKYSKDQAPRFRKTMRAVRKELRSKGR
jgi:hypothetical protein